MRLKQVILTNFKSYRDVTDVLIDDGTTVIVGKNGCGKSNFLQAMDFVLGSRHADLNRLTRPRFINDAGDNKRASIEVVLQDDDKVFGETIRIKRLFNICTDVYYFNGSRIQKLELSFILEVLGFPRPTPFHATSGVQLKELLFSTPSERLHAFISYLGLCISRAVSFLEKLLPGMEEWEAKFNQIDQMLKNYNPDEIQAEDLRHREYTALCQIKSALRFKMSSLRIQLWKTSLADEANTLSHRGGSNAEVLHSLKCSIASAKIALEKAKNDAFSSKMLLDGLMQPKELIVKNIESVNLSINDMEGQVEVEELNISVGTVDVEESYQENIEKLETNMKTEQAAVEDIYEKLSKEEQNRAHLLLILSTKDKFSTSSEKTRWVQSEIGTLKKAYDKNLEALKKYEYRRNTVKNSIVDCENKVKILNEEEGVYLNLRKELNSMKHRIGELQIEFHKLNSQENVLLNEVGVVNNSLKFKKIELSCKVGSSTINGMESVEFVRDYWSSTHRSLASGCYGTVLDNIECDDALNSALEAAAGNRLFSQIVVTDTVGTAVLREMKSRNLPGEVVFLPLNRILSRESSQVETPGVELLISQLSYSPQFHGAISHLFGSTLLCRDLKIATKVAKTYRCVCVTIHGDRVAGGGPITGGYFDRNTAMRTLYLAYKTLKATYADKIMMLQNTNEEINICKNSIDSSVAFIQRGEIKIMNGDRANAQKILMGQLENLKKDESHCEEQIRVMKLDNECLIKKKEALEKSFHEDVSAMEAQLQLQTVNRKALELKKQYNQRNTNLDLLKSEIALLKNKVSCLDQKDAIKVATSSKCKAIHQKLDDYRAKEKLLQSRSRILDNDIAKASSNLSSANQKVERLKAELDNLKQQLLQANLNVARLDLSGAGEAIGVYKEKIKVEEKVKKLEAKNADKQFLGELTGLSLEELQNRLADTTKKLETVAGTLKLSSRALKMEIRCMELSKKYDILKDDHTSLCVMITKFHSWVLQHVSMSLEQVSNLFTHYFSMMVPNGRGSLEIKRSRKEPVLAITGIQINVLFAGDFDVSLFSGLSTGQQVVVFLSTVFALLKSQRPCFCVLDEIDQALTNDRIEGLLCAISELHLQGHQFLITSHNNYMVNRGLHHFAINFKRGRSRIHPVSLSEAIALVERDGDVSKRPSTSVLSSSQSTCRSNMESQSSQDSWRP